MSKRSIYSGGAAQLIITGARPMAAGAEKGDRGSSTCSSSGVSCALVCGKRCATAGSPACTSQGISADAEPIHRTRTALTECADDRCRITGRCPVPRIVIASAQHRKQKMQMTVPAPVINAILLRDAAAALLAGSFAADGELLHW